MLPRRLSGLENDLGTSVYCHVFDKHEVNCFKGEVRKASERKQFWSSHGWSSFSGTSRAQRTRLTKAGRCNEMDKGHVDFSCEVSLHLRVKVILEP